MAIYLDIYFNTIKWLEAHLLTCPSRKFLHMDCPGCGIQRSAIAFLKGDWLLSLQIYPALLPIIFLLTFTILHLKFRFEKGTRYILLLQIAVVSIISVHYIYKILNHQIFY